MLIGCEFEWFGFWYWGIMIFDEFNIIVEFLNKYGYYFYLVGKWYVGEEFCVGWLD